LQPTDASRARRDVSIERTIDPRWLLVEEGFELGREHEIESMFAISNGYSGTRGSLAELSALSSPATFVAGIFQQLDIPGSVPELMVLPDWTAVKIWIDHQPLSLDQGEILEHRRILDLHRGMFWREWRHRDPSGRITRIVAFRLASLIDRHLLLQSVALTAENYSSTVQFESAIEAAPGVASLPAPDWIARSSSARPSVLPLALRAPGRDATIVFGFTSQMLNSTELAGVRTVAIEERRIVERCDINVEVGTECQLHRFISLCTTRESPKPFECVIDHLQSVVPAGVSAASLAHASEWESRWHSADVEIEGDEFLQQALRFAGYHLIGASNPHNRRVSIGARGLTGTAYMGHVFWDTEIYMLPFYILSHPASARSLLEYRYHTLNAAREKARSFGFRGAMYPWESADTGEEVTPQAVIMPNGEVMRVRNGELEIHITADIAFAIWQYWKATGDDDFFLRFGAEILLESARFWASRGTLEADGAYHIRHVIGPDEYHENVDDNAYTNLMAAWNLRRGTETANLFKHRWPERRPELAGRLQLTDEELTEWSKLAEAMFTGFDPKTLLFEQFSGYFQKEHIDLKSYEPRSAAMDIILGYERIQQTDIVKQADVVMAMYLLWDEFPPEVREANFRYYEPRTGHGSSLSPSIHALVAARLGDLPLAQQYLKQASEIDLGNNMGNAAGGVHMGAQGGLWQAVVHGFAGVNAGPDGFSLAPNLLPQWLRLTFPLQWHKSTARVSIEPAAIRIKVQGGEPLKVSVVQGKTLVASPEKEYVAERSEPGWKPWQVLEAASHQEVL
jgi:trehalose/maltose hydrolase-like predicted phosphorylase